MSLAKQVCADSADNGAPEIKSSSLVTTHFWVAEYPYLDLTLFSVAGESTFIQEDGALASFPESFSLNLTVHDCDGLLVNQVGAIFPTGSVGTLELGQFLSGLKLEGGLKHALLSVEHPEFVRCVCRAQTQSAAAIIGEPLPLSIGKGAFFPVTFCGERKSVVALSNPTTQSVTAKCRLFQGKRTPEFTVSLPPLGSRIYGVESEFSEYLSLDPGYFSQAYLRVTTKSSKSILVQILEVTEGGKGNRMVSFVS